MDQCSIFYGTASCFKILTIVNKPLHGMGPTYLRDRLKIKNSIRHQKQTSSTILHLDIPFNRKRTAVDREFSYSSAQHWNTLPDHIEKVNNIQHLKRNS